MFVEITDIFGTSAPKTKIPEYGLRWKDKQTGNYIKLTYVQNLGLYKEPVENCIPTICALGGVKLNIEESERIVEAFTEHPKYGQDTKLALNQTTQIVGLLRKKYRARKQTVTNYPFCQIDFLTEPQLEFINTVYGLSIEYEAYILFMENLFTEDTLKRLYLQIGVSDIPEFNLGAVTSQSMTDQETETQLAELFNKFKKQ